ncbi:hypothetical protein ACIOD2_14580 [Amycolatopsis sp. NPDC088138]|uniref:hypothetical protein n=1 Tax=Amycolatopsis sp. NPDC088138 TaxID=3363938 RepID=UPI0037F23012
MIDWGSVPAYFGGIALVLTLIVLFRDRREKIRAQADRVAAWVQRGRADGELHRVVVKNAGDLPCTDLRIWWTVGYRTPAKLRFSKVFGADTDGHRKPRYEHAVGPGETLVLLETAEDCAVRGLEFTDAAGRQWSRIDARLVRQGTLRRRVRRTWQRLRPG